MWSARHHSTSAMAMRDGTVAASGDAGAPASAAQVSVPLLIGGALVVAPVVAVPGGLRVPVPSFVVFFFADLCENEVDI
jgi:hypothetical protein